MAPKRGTKRAAEATMSATDEAKKMKETLKNYGVSKTWYDGVVEGLQSPVAEDPLSVRKMLIAMLPEGLCVPADQRHAYQTANVQMVSESLQKVICKLEEKLATASAEVDRIEASKGELQSKVDAAEEALGTALENEQSCKLRLADVTRTVISCKSAVSGAETAQREKAQAREKALEEKAQVEILGALAQALACRPSLSASSWLALQATTRRRLSFAAVLAEEFRLLCDGEVQGQEAQAHYGKLESLAKQIGFEASLLTALPTSILKEPASRGSFDAMVVAQLAEGLGKRLSALKEELLASEPGATAAAQAVETAQKELQVAFEQQQVEAEKYKAAQELRASAETAKSQAHAEAAEHEPLLRQAVQARLEAETEVESFKNYNWACFEKLRDHQQLSSAQRAVEAQMEVEAAEAGA
ncbi:unnamed protein product [Durusdinium trenchii]|uniref:Uncharacterized protein n=1 Tax=Durusdinium trenchii TaxID=1381693 RepID=A0ABP0KJN5_9DINO